MAILKLPATNTRMVRRLAGFEKKTPGKWHFLLNKTSKRKCLCGELLSESYRVEYTLLADVQSTKDICKSCWRF